MQGNSAASAVHANPLLSDSVPQPAVWIRAQRRRFPRVRQGELADVLASNAGLQQFAQPVIRQLAQQMAETQSVVILSDASGLVLNTFGDMQALEKAQRFARHPVICGVNADAAPMRLAPRWRLMTAVKLMASSIS